MCAVLVTRSRLTIKIDSTLSLNFLSLFPLALSPLSPFVFLALFSLCFLPLICAFSNSFFFLFSSLLFLLVSSSSSLFFLSSSLLSVSYLLFLLSSALFSPMDGVCVSSTSTPSDISMTKLSSSCRIFFLLSSSPFLPLSCCRFPLCLFFVCPLVCSSSVSPSIFSSALLPNSDYFFSIV